MSALLRAEGLTKHFPVLGGPLDEGVVLGREGMGARALGDRQVLLDVRLIVHAGEDDRDLRVVPDPLQRPFGRRAAHLGVVPDGFHSGRRRD